LAVSRWVGAGESVMGKSVIGLRLAPALRALPRNTSFWIVMTQRSRNYCTVPLGKNLPFPVGKG
jgi:hypothetical protein